MAARHYQSLDAMRGVAALIVLFGHASAMIYGQTWFPGKGLAVIFFFALSGFVMSANYEDSLKSGLTFFSFMKRRVARLYPLIILSSILSFVTFLAFDPSFHVSTDTAIALAGSLFALPTMKLENGFSRFPINPPEWSLFCEIICYAIYAIAIPHFARLALIVVTIALCTTSAWLFFQPFGASLPANVIVAMSAFCIGAIISRTRHNNPHVDKAGSMAAMIGLGGILGLLTVLPDEYTAITKIGCLFVVAPSILWVGSFTFAPNEVSRWLGAISYPLYLLHWPILVLTTSVLLPTWGGVLSILFAVIASVAVAVVGELYFDRPARSAFAQRRRNRDLGYLAEAVLRQS